MLGSDEYFPCPQTSRGWGNNYYFFFQMSCNGWYARNFEFSINACWLPCFWCCPVCFLWERTRKRPKLWPKIVGPHNLLPLLSLFYYYYLLLGGEVGLLNLFWTWDVIVCRFSSRWATRLVHSRFFRDFVYPQVSFCFSPDELTVLSGHTSPTTLFAHRTWLKLKTALLGAVHLLVVTFYHIVGSTAVWQSYGNGIALWET